MLMKQARSCIWKSLKVKDFDGQQYADLKIEKCIKILQVVARIMGLVGVMFSTDYNPEQNKNYHLNLKNSRQKKLPLGLSVVLLAT